VWVVNQLKEFLDHTECVRCVTERSAHGAERKSDAVGRPISAQRFPASAANRMQALALVGRRGSQRSPLLEELVLPKEFWPRALTVVSQNSEMRQMESRSGHVDSTLDTDTSASRSSLFHSGRNVPGRSLGKGAVGTKIDHPMDCRASQKR
jgi:hypothetical protein